MNNKQVQLKTNVTLHFPDINPEATTGSRQQRTWTKEHIQSSQRQINTHHTSTALCSNAYLDPSQQTNSTRENKRLGHETKPSRNHNFIVVRK